MARGLFAALILFSPALPMGSAVAEFQERSDEEALRTLRAREWETLARRDQGQATDAEVLSVRLELARALAAQEHNLAAGRHAAQVLEIERPLDPLLRQELLALACSRGTAVELDTRVVAYAAAGWLDVPTRLDLAAQWLRERRLDAAERVLAPFRAEGAQPHREADALRAELALRRGRKVAAAVLLEQVAATPRTLGDPAREILLLGAEDALSQGEFARAATLLAGGEEAEVLSPDQRARRAMALATVARAEGDLARASRALQIDLGQASDAQRAHIAIAAARVAIERDALTEADALLRRAQTLLGVAAITEDPDLGAARAQWALASREPTLVWNALEPALRPGCWIGGDAAGEALECFAAWLAEEPAEPVLQPVTIAEKLGVPRLALARFLVELRVRGPRRAFVIALRAERVEVRPVMEDEVPSLRIGARLYEPETRAWNTEDAPYAEFLNAQSLARAMQPDAEVRSEDGREFLGFGPKLADLEAEEPKVADELRAVAQCFPTEEQHLHLGREATRERLFSLQGRPELHSGRTRYRVLHLIAEIERGEVVARLRLFDAEEEPVVLDLARADEIDAPILPAADLVVMSLFDREAGDAVAFDQLAPWVDAAMRGGALAVWIGVRRFDRDDDARRELGQFYAALADGESAARAAWRARTSTQRDGSSVLRLALREPLAEPIFQFFGDGSFRARGWAPPDLAVLAPDRVRQPWWIYFVTALVLPAVVFLLFRRLSTGQVRAPQF